MFKILFNVDINIPKNTAKTSAVTETLQIAHGVITWVSVFFPPGCARLAHVVILHHELQIWPSTGNMDLAGDQFPIEWAEYYESYQPPYALKIKAWNDDDSYPHKVTIRVAVLPRKAVLSASLGDMFKGMIGALLPKKH